MSGSISARIPRPAKSQREKTLLITFDRKSLYRDVKPNRFLFCIPRNCIQERTMFSLVRIPTLRRIMQEQFTFLMDILSRDLLTTATFRYSRKISQNCRDTLHLHFRT